LNCHESRIVWPHPYVRDEYRNASRKQIDRNRRLKTINFKLSAVIGQFVQPSRLTTYFFHAANRTSVIKYDDAIIKYGIFRIFFFYYVVDY